ncbi:hypothetical protein UC8_05610 [Roseimaritima ulvae]|uniref:Tetratricopeptide repeat protein n=1 Tax=Roseimaritima ulvae TaxID=980254 RepID=A0A5B9QIB0_9BACT|nr:hypothetical protein UC8_05610 [Roseimaritima ulvae]
MVAKDLVFDLQLAASYPSSKSEQELLVLAQQYADACSRTNERIFECVKLLRVGMRSEAIRLAELEPNILDELSSLNFGERGAWLALAEQLGVPTPDPAFEMAREISDAYDQHEETKGLACQLRLQNIYRRPKEERLQTLEKLLQVDPNNPAWLRNYSLLEDSVG